MSAYLHLNLVFLVWVGILDMSAATGMKAAYQCPGIEVHVQYLPEKSRTLFCDGARRAVAFMRSHGFDLQRPIGVELRESAMRNHLGFYDAAKQKIEFLTFDQAVRQCARQSPFGVAMDEELYRSFAAHEVAHAIVDQHFTGAPAKRITQEYVAYVVQLITMAEDKRQLILERYRVAAYKSVDAMSLIYYGLNPSAFGVKAYRHYLSLSDGTAFLHGLMSGEIKPGFAP